MRRLAPLLAIPLLLVALPSARAQQAPSVVLRLVHQTRWNDAQHKTLDVVIGAVNRTDQTLSGISIFLGINTATGSRTEYEQSLQADTGSELLGNTFVEAGTLEPGQRATYILSQDVTTLANIGRSDIYPMVVQFRSHDVSMATLRSPVIYLARNPPLTPLDLSWSFVLSAPIAYQPDGFHSPWLQRQVASGQRLREEVDELARVTSRSSPPALDVAVSPQLVDQLLKMTRGYTLRLGGGTKHVAKGAGGSADAGHVLAQLRTIVASPGTETSAMPYSSPSFPALISAGLAQDVPQQLSRGLQDVAAALGVQPGTAVLHPPGSRLDQASLYALHQNGVRLLLVDADTLRQPDQPRGYAKPPVAELSVGTSTPLEGIVPDAGVQQLLEGDLPRENPRLAVQTVLGELAQIWLEQPSVTRGVALTLGEKTADVRGSFFGPFLRSIAAAPWLHTMKAITFASAHPAPTDETDVLRPAAAGPLFDPTYLAELQSARQKIDTYSSILTSGTAVTSDLDRLILLAEAGQFITQQEGGLAFLASVSERLNREFRSVTPDTSSVVTLTSRNGTIPVPIRNLTGHAVRVRVDLEAGGRLAVHGNSRVVTIPGDGVTLTFGVQARTTGRFPVQVIVSTPDGRTELSQGSLVVRSTAYNRIALVLTIGAALVLIALWARRFMPWTKR